MTDRLSHPVLIRGGRLLDPETGVERDGDLFIAGGRIARCPEVLPDHTEVIDAAGFHVAPGFIDLHVHLREPGGEHAETIATGAAAAARGGFTTIVAMPNTQPPIDTPERVAFVMEQGRKADQARVLTSACLTQGRAGREIAPLAELAAAGAVAFTDDGCTVQDDRVMRVAMNRAAELGLPVMDHAQDREMELRGGAMHEGRRARELGIPGIPSEAETRIIERDIQLAGETGCALHIQHVSCGESVPLIHAAQQRGLRVTAEATPHHLMFCEDDVDPARPDQYKMNPPLRTAEDRDQLKKAVGEGILTVLATDHAPHPMAEKARSFVEAPFGVVGLETAVGVTYTLLVQSGVLTRMDWLRAWTTCPARLLNRQPPSLAVGQPADIVVLDLDGEWMVDPGEFASKGRNTPFAGMKWKGRSVVTLVDGRTRWAC